MGGPPHGAGQPALEPRRVRTALGDARRRAAAAWRRIPPVARRPLAAVVGAALLLAGAAMLVLPGPGLVTLAAGLGILALEFAWARRLLAALRRKLP